MSRSFYSTFGFVAATLLVVPALASAAVLYPAPQEIAIENGRTAEMVLMLDSEGEQINVVAGQVRYPTDLVDAAEVSTGGSFLTLWPDPPTVDKAKGLISFSGGVPKGAVVKAGQVLSIMFRAKAKGQAKIEVVPESAEVYLNDGAGTKIQVTGRYSTIRIENQSSMAPRVISATHPDESAWSQNRTLTVAWLKHDQSFYSFELSRDPLAVPDDQVDAGDGSMTYHNLQDGLWYFTIKEKVGNDPWGPAAAYRIMIDATAPTNLSAGLFQEPASKIWLAGFNAADSASGVDRYEVRELRPRFTWFPFFLRGEWQRAVSPFKPANQKLVSNISVRAIDRAGNVRVVSVSGGRLAQARWNALTAIAAALVLALVAGGTAALNRRRKKPE